MSFTYPLAFCAGVAQLVEHLPCKQGVAGSSPFVSSIFDFVAGRNAPCGDGNDETRCETVFWKGTQAANGIRL